MAGWCILSSILYKCVEVKVINYDLLALLEQVLGKGKRTSGSNYAFFSPFISHYKPKLEIDLAGNGNGENKWHCWVSNKKGRSIYKLFKEMKVSRNYFDELNKILKVRNLYTYKNNTKEKDEVVTLPSQFIPLSMFPTVKDKAMIIQMKQALLYLKKRGIIPTDIFRYNIGYCADGEYSGRVVIPSYDDNLNLNFFVSRTIFDDVNAKHKNPTVSKNIIGFESLINWDMPITLVEGAFDAITVRSNAIPLFGKTLSPLLKEKILIRKPPMVRVALDPDAISDALEICDFLLSNGIPTSLIKIEDGDINETGFSKFYDVAESTSATDQYELIKEKILYA